MRVLTNCVSILMSCNLIAIQTEKILRNEGISVTLLLHDKNDSKQKTHLCHGIMTFRSNGVDTLNFDVNAAEKTFVMSFRFADISVLGIGSGFRYLQTASINDDLNMYITSKEPNSCVVMSFEGSFRRDKMFISLIIIVSNALGRFDLYNDFYEYDTFRCCDCRDSNEFHCSEEYLH